MKTRIGFVSNSSSSSYILAIDDKDIDPNNFKVTVNISKMADSIKVFRTLDDLIQYHKDEYDEDEDEISEDNLIAQALKKGKTVLMVNFSDRNEEINLYDVEKDNNFEIVDYY